MIKISIKSSESSTETYTMHLLNYTTKLRIRVVRLKKKKHDMKCVSQGF